MQIDADFIPLQTDNATFNVFQPLAAADALAASVFRGVST